MAYLSLSPLLAVLVILCMHLTLHQVSCDPLMMGKMMERVNDSSKYDDSRKSVKSDCITPIFEVMQSCCPVPLLVPREPQAYCMANQGGMANQANMVAPRDTKEGLFHTIRENLLAPFRRRGRMNDQLDFDTLAKQFIGGPLCFIECIFGRMKLTNEDKSLNIENIETQWVAPLKSSRRYSSPVWVTIVGDAITKCKNEVAELPVPTISSEKGLCTTLPGVFMECVRKALILGCPENDFISSPGCIEGRGRLERCNPLDVIRSVSTGGGVAGAPGAPPQPHGGEPAPQPPAPEAAAPPAEEQPPPA